MSIAVQAHLTEESSMNALHVSNPSRRRPVSSLVAAAVMAAPFLQSKTARKVTAVVSVTVALLATFAASAHANHITMNATKWVNASEAYSMSRAYAKMAAYAAPACGGQATAAGAAISANLRYAYRLTPFGQVTATWVSALTFGYGRFLGVNWCDIAWKASYGAAHAAYWGSRGGATTHMYIRKQDRTGLPDVCRTWHSFNGQYAYSDLRTPAMFRSCPRG